MNFDPRPIKLTSSAGHRQEYSDCFVGRMALLSDIGVIFDCNPGITISVLDDCRPGHKQITVGISASQFSHLK
jgi:hypothetical protein